MNITSKDWKNMTIEEAEAKLRELIDECNGDVYETVVRHIDENTPEHIVKGDEVAKLNFAAGYPYDATYTEEYGRKLFNQLFIENTHEIAEFITKSDGEFKKLISKRVEEPIGTITYPDGTIKEAHEMHFTVLRGSRTPGNTVGFFLTALFVGE